MRGVNRVMLIGNLGKDPDVQYLEGNIGVAKFSLATTETFKDRTGKTDIPKPNGIRSFCGVVWLNFPRNIFIREALFTLKEDCVPEVGKTKRAIRNLRRKL